MSTLSLDEITAQLPDELVADIPQELLSAVLAAERSHQRSVTHHDGKRPAELDEALVARVRVNLEQLPAGASLGDVIRAGGRDEEVRKLEAPYSTRVSGAQPTEAAIARVIAAQEAAALRTKAPAKKAAPRKAAAAKKPAAKAKAAPKRAAASKSSATRKTTKK